MNAQDEGNDLCRRVNSIIAALREERMTYLQVLYLNGLQASFVKHARTHAHTYRVPWFHSVSQMNRDARPRLQQSLHAPPFNGISRRVALSVDCCVHNNTRRHVDRLPLLHDLMLVFDACYTRRLPVGMEWTCRPSAEVKRRDTSNYLRCFQPPYPFCPPPRDR